MSLDLFSIGGECGCAAKIPAGSLCSILEGLDLPSSPSLVVGPETLDDAGVFKISDELCLVQTVDYFPPIARDPYVYGQIAAANSLSDVYAMGGKPLTALAVVCFPAERLAEALQEITRGAVDKLKEAGVVLIGGHSIVDSQMKYGLAVTGVVHPNEILDNAHARPDDVLILTKPLGTGITVMAVKAAEADRGQEDEANRCMSTLNAEASLLAREFGASSCTDITGFGFLGHVWQMARASGASIETYVDSVPRLDGVLEYAAMGLLSGAAYANREYVGEAVEFDENVELAEQDLLFDPQTSGGLLLSCPEGVAQEFIDRAASILTTPCAVVGRVTETDGKSSIRVRRRAAVRDEDT